MNTEVRIHTQLNCLIQTTQAMDMMQATADLCCGLCLQRSIDWWYWCARVQVYMTLGDKLALRN